MSNIDPVMLRNNAAFVANAPRIFNVSTSPTTVAEKTFSGPMFDEVKIAFPKARFEAHERAIERMVQAGTRPMTSVQYLLELQRD
jgi:hypothetical protein